MHSKVGDLDITIERDGTKHRFVAQGRISALASDVSLEDLERLEHDLARYREAEAEKSHNAKEGTR